MDLLLGGNDSVISESYMYEVSTLKADVDNSSEYNSYVQEHDPITEFVQVYSIPFLCLLGLVGNSLAAFVFLQKSLRKSSSSIFLATRSFSDNGFLSTLLIIWLSRTFKLQLGATGGLCRVIVFLTYVCGCVSVWLVVFVTIENYVRICKPFIVNRVCQTKGAKVSVMVLWIIAVGIYNFPFWAMTRDTCTPYPEYLHFVQVIVYTDSIITLVLPLICITFFMTAIVCDLIKSYNRRGRLLAQTVKHVKNPMAKVTKMLLSVSVSFFILNLPSHIIRLKLMIASFVDEANNFPTEMDRAIQQITLMVSYMSLAINIFVYSIFGSKFRRVLMSSIFGDENSCCRRVCRKRYPHDGCEILHLTSDPLNNDEKTVEISLTCMEDNYDQTNKQRDSV